MIFIDSIPQIEQKFLEKSNYSKNKLAIISNYSYLNIEEQMTSLIRFVSHITNKQGKSRKIKKDIFAKNAHNKDIWEYVELVKNQNF